MASAKDIRALAQEELDKEKQEKAKARMKVLLRQLDDARIIVANFERELDELEQELANGL